MTLPIKSRHGLTRCPSCRAHIQAGATPSTTACPFCGATLHSAPASVAISRGRGGLLAASLLAFGAAGCGGSQAQDESATESTQSDTSGSIDTSATTETSESESDNTNNEDAEETATPGDNTAVAAYGGAPDSFSETPADTPRPTPRYGLPPMR